MSSNLEPGRISVPTDNPGKCQRCNRTHTHSGRKLDIHWSIRAQAWLCRWCCFEAPDAEAQQ